MPGIHCLHIDAARVYRAMCCFNTQSTEQHACSFFFLRAVQGIMSRKCMCMHAWDKTPVLPIYACTHLNVMHISCSNYVPKI